MTEVRPATLEEIIEVLRTWPTCDGHDGLVVPAGIEVLEGPNGHHIVSQHALITFEPRPRHCDRGHYLALLHPSPLGEFHRLNIEYYVDGWDPGRFYMDLTRGLQECVDWLADRESRVG